MNKVLIYTHPDCKASEKLKQLLQNAEIKYLERDVSRDVHYKREMIERSGGKKHTPQIFVDGKYKQSWEDLGQIKELSNA